MIKIKDIKQIFLCLRFYVLKFPNKRNRQLVIFTLLMLWKAFHSAENKAKKKQQKLYNCLDKIY